jgi:hypothetical protein
MRISEDILDTVGNVTPNIEINIVNLNPMIRNNAYFIIYLVLTLFLLFVQRKIMVLGIKVFGFTFLVGFIYWGHG